MECYNCNNGKPLCDDCPSKEYPDDPQWKYPDVILETALDAGVVVITEAFPHKRKYGWHYHSYASRGSQTKGIRWYKTRDEAVDNHWKAVDLVVKRRASLRSRSE